MLDIASVRQRVIDDTHLHYDTLYDTPTDNRLTCQYCMIRSIALLFNSEQCFINKRSERRLLD